MRTGLFGHHRSGCDGVIQLSLFSDCIAIGSAQCRTDHGIETTADVLECLAQQAPVAIGVSGGKDSSAVAIRTTEYLDAIGHHGPRILVHSDLGRVEWRQSLPACARLAAYVGLDLVIVRRTKGDLLDRIRQRWKDNIRRYAELSCVKLILPWPTAAMRYCTGELKSAVICRELIRLFRGRTILSVLGIEREESSTRAKASVANVQPRLSSARLSTSGLDWRPILHWTKAEVLQYLCAHGFELHEAYTRYGSTRVSCAFCVLGSLHDLQAAATCGWNADIFCELVQLEAESTFAFQSSRWLADVAPQLLSPELSNAVMQAKQNASIRESAEARIPAALLFQQRRPMVVPTISEATLLADIRKTVADAVGIQIGFTDGDTIRSRYAELLSPNGRS